MKRVIFCVFLTAALGLQAQQSVVAAASATAEPTSAAIVATTAAEWHPSHVGFGVGGFVPLSKGAIMGRGPSLQLDFNPQGRLGAFVTASLGGHSGQTPVFGNGLGTYRFQTATHLNLLLGGPTVKVVGGRNAQLSVWGGAGAVFGESTTATQWLSGGPPSQGGSASTSSLGGIVYGGGMEVRFFFHHLALGAKVGYLTSPSPLGGIGIVLMPSAGFTF